MSTYDVLTTPQAIFEQGLQEDFLVTNTGLTSIWLDSDSSISVATSYRLPPLSTVVWSGGKPLWATADTLSRFIAGAAITNLAAKLTITRNASPLIPATDGSITELVNVASTSSVGQFSFQNVECGHLNSIRIAFRVDAATNLTAAGETFTVTASWRGVTNQGIHADTYEFFYPRDPNSSDLYITLPVLGPMVTLTVAAMTATAFIASHIRVLGMTQVVKPQFQSFTQSACSLTHFAPRITEGRADITSFQDWDLNPVYFNSKASVVDLGLRYLSGVTVAGKLVLISGTTWIDDWDIPVGPAGHVDRKTWILPSGLPSHLGIATAPTNVAGYDLSVTLRESASPIYL
jgi:hypothetical protein